jgi:hypothetical protein
MDFTCPRSTRSWPDAAGIEAAKRTDACSYRRYQSDMPNNVNTLADVSVAFRHGLCVIVLQAAAVIFLAAAVEGFPRSTLLQVIVGNETVPPGGTVQLKFFLVKPAQIAGGELAMDLDPSMFSSVASVSAFGANGDTAGVAQVQGLHVDVHFTSPSAGIGSLSEIPVVVVTATALPAVVVGQTANVTADPTGSPWLGLAVPNNTGGATQPTYSVSVSPGTVTIGGAVSITSITPGGGVLPGGTAVAIQGTGFSSATTAEIDGATVASVQVAGPQMMSLILGGPTELTGKRITVMNPDGSEVDAFAFAPAAPVSAPGIIPLDGSIPILPLQTYTAAYIAGTSFVLVRNPGAGAVQLVEDSFALNELGSEHAFAIPAGGSLLLQSQDIRVGQTLLIASTPVQMVQLITFSPTSSAYQFLGSVPIAVGVTPLQVNEFEQSQSNSVSWVWQMGTDAPQAQTIDLGLPLNQPDTDYTVSVATTSGGPWLSVTPSGAINCQSSGTVGGYPGGCAILQVSANPGTLAPGIYRGTLTITPVATVFHPAVEPAVIPFAITVTASLPTQTLIYGYLFRPNNTVDTVVLPPGMFTGPVALNVFTDSGGNWVSAVPTGGSSTGTAAPTSITITANTAGFGVGSYSGTVVVTGSGNTLVIPIQLLVDGSVRLTTGDPTAVNPALAGTVGALNFVAQPGAGPPLPQTVPVSTEDCIPTQCFDVNPDLSSLAASVQTHSGGNWLSATVSQGAAVVSANPAGLGVGVYVGAVTLTASGIASGQIPVMLVVEGGSLPALVAAPGLVTEFEPNAGGGIQPLSVCLNSTSVPLAFSVQVSTSDGGNWLTAANNGGATSGAGPECINFSVNAVRLHPGTTARTLYSLAGRSQSPFRWQ